MNESTALAPATPLAMLQQLIDRGTDPEALGKMMDLAERWQAIEAKKAYTAAVEGFKRDCPPIIKRNQVHGTAKDERGVKIPGVKGPHMYNFASYDDIKAVTVPFERKHGIVTGFSFDVSPGGNLLGKLRVTVGSHTEEFSFGVPIPKGMNTNATQDFGAAVTYLKRYLYLAAFDLVVTGEDSDACGLFEKITPDQIGQLNDLIGQIVDKKLPHNSRAFLSIFGVGEDGDLGDIPVAEFETAVRMLKAKLEAKK